MNVKLRELPADAHRQMVALVGTTLELDEVAARALEQIRAVIACETACLYIRRGDSLLLHSRQPTPASGTSRLRQSAIPDAFVTALFAEMLGVQGPVRRSQGAPALRALGDQAALGDWLGAPMSVGARVIGQVILLAFEGDYFDDEHGRQLFELVQAAAPAVENAQLYAEATRRLLQLALLNEVSAAVSATLDFDEVVRHTVTALQSTLKYEYVGLMLPDEAGDALVMHPHYAGLSKAQRGQRLPLGQGTAGRVALSGRTERVDDVLLDPDYVELVPGVRAELCVPIRIGERVIGVLDAKSKHPYAFSGDDEQMLFVVAGQLASVLENARLFDTVRRRADELAALLDVAEAITSSLTLPSMLEAVSERAAQVCRVERCAVLLLDDDEAHLQVAAANTQTPSDWLDYVQAALQSVPLLELSEVSEALVSGRPQLIEETNASAGALELVRAFGRGLLLLTPLRISDRSIGLLALSQLAFGTAFSSRQVSLASAIARQVAIAVESAWLRDAEREAQAQLTQSARLAAVGELAAGIAHEINNPLTTITGFTEWALRGTAAGEPLHEDLELILKEARRARDVVRRLLDFARQSDSDRERTQLNEIVQETLDLLRHAAATQGVQIDEDYAPNLPLARLDPNQIKQVMLNLLNNAIQAMPAGGHLWVTTEAGERAERPGVSVSIRDTGPGIKSEDHARVFEPFYTTKPVGVGSGLGLSVSYGIVSDHGGYIDLDSAPGEGATFTVWLPIEEDIGN